jgi:predicted site-specific integrase-resolvase
MIKMTINGSEVELYQPLDAMEYCQVSAATIAKWRREGFLQGIAVGRGFVFTKQQLDDCLSIRNKDREEIEVTHA